MSKTAPDIQLPFIVYSRKDKKPVYQQVFESFKTAILNGSLKAGDRLPASRQLASGLGVSRNVLILAFEQLQIEGYIVSQTGKGSFVADNIRQRILPGVSPDEARSGSDKASMRRGRYNARFLEILSQPVTKANTILEEIVPFQISVPDPALFPFNAWITLAARVHRHMGTYHLGYHDSAGYGPLREVIANYIRVNRGVRCGPEHIIITNGSRQALWLLAQLLLQKGDQYWMENPGYHGADIAMKHTGASPCYIPATREYGMDIDFAISKFPHAKLAYLTPSHQYPLGGSMPLAKRQQLIRWAAKEHAWLIEDDYDSELQYTGRPIPSLQGMDDFDNVIYIGTFSKVLFPALRLAYVVMPTKEDAELFAICKGVCDRQHSLIDQMILTDFIKDGHYARMLKKMRLHNGQKLRYFLDLIRQYLAPYIDYLPPQAGMHLTCYLVKPEIAVAFFEKVKQAGLIVTSLRDFSHPPFDQEGFTLGYIAFSEKELKKGVLKLRDIFQACY